MDFCLIHRAIPGFLIFIFMVTSAQFTYAESNSWSCLCYQEHYQGKIVEATACRTLKSVCQKFEDRVKRGSSAIVKGSLSASCTQVQGAHPADVLGSRKQWLPSKRPGATWTPNGCYLRSKLESSGSNTRVIRHHDQARFTLRSGWTFRPMHDAQSGQAWFKATRAGNTSLRFDIPSVETSATPSACHHFKTDLTLLYASRSRMIFGATLHCEAAPDNFEVVAERRHILMTIEDHLTAPELQAFWSYKSSMTKHEIYGSLSMIRYHFEMKSSTIDVWKERITCGRRLLFELAQTEQT